MIPTILTVGINYERNSSIKDIAYRNFLEQKLIFLKNKKSDEIKQKSI